MKIKSYIDDYSKQIFTILLILIILLFNLVSHKVVDRYSLKLDMTENALYEFSPVTKKIVSELSSPVTITVFNNEEDFVLMLKEVLQRYTALSPLINLDFADPYENPVLLDSYAVRGVQVQLDDIIVERADRIKSFSMDDMYNFNAGKTDIIGLNAEQQLTSALLYVNDSRIPSAAFTDGHNERPSKALTSLFKDNNYKVTRGNLATILSESPDMLVIAAPSRDFPEDETGLLETYMNSGGNTLIFLEPAAVSFPNLEGFLLRWGIRAGKELVFEEKAYTGNNPINIVPMYEPHLINSYFMNTRLFLTMPSARSLYALENPGTAYDVRTVLSSTPSSYGKKDQRFDQLKKSDGDTPGPFSLVISCEKELEKGESRMVVIGSRNIFADDLMGFSSYGNSEFLVQTLNWLNKVEQSLHIPPKTIHSAPLLIQSGQALILGLITCLIIPLLFFLTGIIIFIRRRRL